MACTLLTNITFAQKAELTLVDSSRFVTKLKYYSDEHLHTAAGAIPYSSIYSVRFNSKDRKKAEFFLEMLDSMKIKVVFANEPIEDNASKYGAPSLRLADSLARSREPPHIAASFGFGGGIDYGGLGMRIGVPVTPAIHLFGAVGYALIGVGYNAGIMVTTSPASDLSLTISAMYGYNGALSVGSSPRFEKFYYGPSAGIGARYLVGRRHTNFWNVSVILPFRDPEFHRIADLYGAQYSPILVSLGFNFGIKGRR